MIWLEDKKGQIKKPEVGIEACNNKLFTGIGMGHKYVESHSLPQ